MNAIIFDLDGVLCHTDEYHYMAWKAIADELHIPFNREVNNQLRGVSRMESLKLILRNSPVRYSEQEKFLLADLQRATTKYNFKGFGRWCMIPAPTLLGMTMQPLTSTWARTNN